jgi:hypothetical protein
VADRTVRRALMEFLHRGQRHRLANQLIAFLLFTAALYLLLLLAILLFGLPLLVFHLLVFTSLSLFPLFLLLAPEAGQTIQILRCLDEHCQIEAYLAAPSAEHRLFLENRVRSLLDRRRAEGALRVRLHLINRYLAIGVVGLFLVFQLSSLLTLRRFSPSLSGTAVKTMQARSAAAEKSSRQELPLELARRRGQEESGVAAAPEYSSRSEALSRSERRDRRQEEMSAQQMESALSTGEARLNTPAEQEPGASSEPFPWIPLPRGEGGFGSALKGAVEKGPEPDQRQGSSPSGVGEAGKALMDSPLRDYSSSLRRGSIQTKGGTKLAAQPGAGPVKDQELLRELFADFPSLVVDKSGFDPAIERIRKRYMELLDERY